MSLVDIHTLYFQMNIIVMTKLIELQMLSTMQMTVTQYLLLLILKMRLSYLWCPIQLVTQFFHTSVISQHIRRKQSKPCRGRAYKRPDRVAAPMAILLYLL